MQTGVESLLCVADKQDRRHVKGKVQPTATIIFQTGVVESDRLFISLLQLLLLLLLNSKAARAPSGTIRLQKHNAY